MPPHPCHRFALQRLLLHRDGARWRTVQTFTMTNAGAVLECADVLGRVGGQIEWRVVTDDYFQSALLRWKAGTGWTMLERRVAPT